MRICVVFSEDYLFNPYHKPVSAVTSKQKRKIFHFGKESVFSGKNHPLLENKKFKLSLCMSLVFCASRKISFNDDNHILKFFTEGFENLRSSFFFNPKICYQVLSSAHGCIFYFLFGKFGLDIRNKIADNRGTALPHKIDFDISKDRFCWTNIFIMWFEDYQLPTGRP